MAPHTTFRGRSHFIPNDALSHYTEAQQLVRDRPRDPAGWVKLSQSCNTLSRPHEMLDAARRAFEIAPDDVEVIRQLAHSLANSPTGLIEARALYEKLGSKLPDDPAVLQNAFLYSYLEQDYRGALATLQRLDTVSPGDPLRAARMSRLFRFLGDLKGAKDHALIAAERCADASNPFPYGRSASLRPVFKAMAGDVKGAEADSIALCKDESRRYGLANLDHPRYPKNWQDIIRKKRTRLAGKDLIIFGNGPSLAVAEGRQDELMALDFLSMTMTSFEIVQDMLFSPRGRFVDFICMTHPISFRDHMVSLEDIISKSDTTGLILPLWVRELNAVQKLSDKLSLDEVIWFDCVGDYLAHPGEPIHVPAVNTLLCALSVAILLAPRRIFLFGFDGKIKGDDAQAPGSLYFQENHEAYMETRRDEADMRDFVRSYLLWDTTAFNEIAPHAIRHIALLFDLDLPPIYNVCADSALSPFPRITFDRFLQIARNEQSAA